MDAIIGAIVGAGITALVAIYLNKRRFKQQRSLKEMGTAGEEFVKARLVEMLNDKRWQHRTFDTLRKRFGGFSDDEIRKLLSDVHALRSERKKDGKEIWHLHQRTEEILAARKQRSDRKGLGDLFNQH